jgi:hypothetical protein
MPEQGDSKITVEGSATVEVAAHSLQVFANRPLHLSSAIYPLAANEWITRNEWGERHDGTFFPRAALWRAADRTRTRALPGVGAGRHSGGRGYHRPRSHPHAAAGRGWFEELDCEVGAQYRYAFQTGAEGEVSPRTRPRAGRPVMSSTPAWWSMPRPTPGVIRTGAAGPGRRRCSTNCIPAPWAALPASSSACRNWPSWVSPPSS